MAGSKLSNLKAEYGKIYPPLPFTRDLLHCITDLVFFSKRRTSFSITSVLFVNRGIPTSTKHDDTQMLTDESQIIGIAVLRVPDWQFQLKIRSFL